MLVLGDAHADDPDRRAALYAAYADADESIALQVGDLRHYDLPTETWFVAGNDEDLDVIEALRTGERPPRAIDNAHLLASTVVEVGGLTVAGLSGNFAPTQYERPRADLEGDRRRHFVRADVELLCERADGVDVDVLLTHEAPHGLLYLGYDPGADPIDDLIEALDPSLCLVGHFHRHSVEQIGDAKTVALEPVWDSYYLLDPETLRLDMRDTPDVEGERVDVDG